MLGVALSIYVGYLINNFDYVILTGSHKYMQARYKRKRQSTRNWKFHSCREHVEKGLNYKEGASPLLWKPTCGEASTRSSYHCEEVDLASVLMRSHLVSSHEKPWPGQKIVAQISA